MDAVFFGSCLPSFCNCCNRRNIVSTSYCVGNSLSIIDNGICISLSLYSCKLKQGFPSLPALDRKSTRLNSSHVSSSYAVFCLKKNNVTISVPDLVQLDADPRDFAP